MNAKMLNQITVSEAAQVARVTSHTIRSWIGDGKLPATKTVTGTWRIDLDDLMTCLRRAQYPTRSIQG